MHLHKKLDNLFANGNLWKHRTLRGIFDPMSSEYNDTTIEEKAAILRTMKENEMDLYMVILQYKAYFNEINKPAVAKDVYSGLANLVTHLL